MLRGAASGLWRAPAASLQASSRCWLRPVRTSWRSPDRSEARRAKNDRIDAVQAARTALAQTEQAAPRERWLREALRQVLVTRQGVLVSRTKAINQLKSLIVVAPDHLRAGLRGLPWQSNSTGSTGSPARSGPASSTESPSRPCGRSPPVSG